MHLRCTGDEIRQILQGVTEWIASMVNGNVDPFGDIASAKKSGELGSIAVHMADAISQMMDTLDGLGANNDMTVQITYDLDLGVSHRSLSMIIKCFAIASYSV